MANGDEIGRRDGVHMGNKLLDAEATNVSGPWVSVTPYIKNVSVQVKGAFSWDGTVTIYGTNNDDEAAASGGVAIGSTEAGGVDSLIQLAGFTYRKIRAEQTLRTAGTVTARFEGVR